MNCDRLGLSTIEMQREVATLRHMEKLKGRKAEGRVLIVLGDTP